MAIARKQIRQIISENNINSVADVSVPGLRGSSAFFGIYLLGRYMSFASNN